MTIWRKNPSFNNVTVNDILYKDTFFEDMRFNATRIRQGATAKPDFDTTNLGLLYPQNDDTEIGYISDQMPHAWKIGTSIYPHIHYWQDEAQETVFKLDYRFADNGTDPSGSFTTIAASNFVFTYTSGTILQIIAFPSIDLSAFSGLSLWFDFKLYRDDNIVTGDVLLKGFDFHYEIDRPGSRDEFTK